MSKLTRRRFLAATAATVPLAGCTAGAEEKPPRADVIKSGKGEGTAPIKSVRTTAYDEGNVIMASEIALEVELIDDHGYGKIIAEYQDYSEEYIKTMRTVTRGKDVYEFTIDGEPEYINLTVDCEATDEVEVIVELATEEETTDE